MKSGRISPYYVNLRELSDNIFTIREVVHDLYSFIVRNIDLGRDTIFYGVPEGASKLGFFLNLLHYQKKVGEYHIFDRENKFYLLHLSELEKISQEFLYNITTYVGSEKENIDCVLGVPSDAYREFGYMIANLIYEDVKKEIFLVHSRRNLKKHGEKKDSFFIGKPRGNVLLLSPSFEKAAPIFAYIMRYPEVRNVIFYIEERHGDALSPSDAFVKNNELLKRCRVIVIEDVVTSGSSLLSVVNNLKREGINIAAAISIFDRGEYSSSVEKKLKEVNYISLFYAKEILPEIFDSEKMEKIEEYWKKHNFFNV